MKPALIEALENLVVWVQCDLLPLWLSRGLVAPELWGVARFDGTGEPDTSAPILLASQAQLAYIFARTEQLGWSLGNRTRVRKLMEFSARRGTLPCRSDGYVHSLDRQFTIIDEHHHLSDHALFMLASAAISAAYGDSSDIRRAYNIFDWLELRLSNPLGGWFDSSDLRPTRSSQSHFYMSLTFLYMYEVTQKPRWLDAAETLVMLYRQRLQSQGDFRIYRDYLEDGTPVNRDVWYPEDQFLWIYGVHKFARCSGQKLSAADHYHSVCQSQALGPDGLYREKVGGSEHVAWSTSALAAAMLAGVSLVAEGDQQAADALEHQVGVFFRRCKMDGPRGLFVDGFDADGAPETYTSATTTLTLFDTARDAARLLKTIGVKI